MLSTEQNERLGRVGPGTPCGELMRRYWIPFLPAGKLDDDPVQPVRLLGEDLTCYRDASGNIGLIGNRCLHRSVELRYGIPDVGGLRCPYHGWMYDQTGQCVDTPLEATDSTFKNRIKLPGYPVQELGGLLFAYMGPLPAPILPRWDLFVWPNTIRQIGYSVLNCNWLQCQENTGDPTHAIYLHGFLYKYQLEKMGATERIAELNNRFMKDRDGIKGLYAHATKHGFEKGVIYSKELGAERDYTWRFPFVMFPFYTHVGTAGSPRSDFQIRVPIDDEHTYHIDYVAYTAPPGVGPIPQDRVPYYEIPIWDEHGKPILDTVLNGDMVGWWSQGALVDRSKENLARTDQPVIFLRRQLEEQIKIVEAGGEPVNVFRDPATTPDVLHGSDEPPLEWMREDWHTRFATAEAIGANFHRGYHALQATDRFGPLIPQVKELHRRIEAAWRKAHAVAAIEVG